MNNFTSHNKTRDLTGKRWGTLSYFESLQWNYSDWCIMGLYITLWLFQFLHLSNETLWL